MSFPDVAVYTSHVARIFRIEDVTAGEPKEWIARYRGQLLNPEESVAAYEQLAEAMRFYNITPLFRKEKGGKQLIFLVPSPPVPKLSSNWLINLVLFVLTVLSMMLIGVDVPAGAVSGDESSTFRFLYRNILTGWPFALSMMGILFTHEMGHYLMCRYYKVPASLPFFLPAPLISPLGTLGAFIAMRGIPKNKRVLFDVGANVGTWSRAAARWAPEATVHAFEIVPAAAMRLRAALHDVANVAVRPFGLADRATTLEVPVPQETATVRARVETGDRYLDRVGIDRVDYVRIDTAGGDGSVLRGFRRTLEAARISALQFGYGAPNLVARFRLRDLYDLLEPRGYRVGKLYARGVHFRGYHVDQENCIGSTLVAVHRSQTPLAHALAIG